MGGITIILIWFTAMLTVASVASMLGKRYGAVFPITAMATLIVIANIVASKIVTFGPLTVSAGVIAFSTTFFITDILSEVWGKRTAQKAVWVGFFANLILVLTIFIAIKWPAADFSLEYAEKFSEVLGPAPRIVLASMIAYLISQNHDVWAFHFWKKVTRDKFLWLRNNFSTVISQLLDIVIFTTIAFYGVFETHELIGIITGEYIVKVIIALIDTPFIYLVVQIVKKITPRQKVVEQKI